MFHRFLLLLIPVLLLNACNSMQTSHTAPPPIYKTVKTEVGVASWYGGRDIGRLTANGERYRANDITAAHKKLPFNSLVRVTNLRTGKSTVVRINDRGPYIRGRIIDLTVIPAKQIGLYDAGLSKVRVDVLQEIPMLTKSNMRSHQITPEDEQIKLALNTIRTNPL